MFPFASNYWKKLKQKLCHSYLSLTSPFFTCLYEGLALLFLKDFWQHFKSLTAAVKAGYGEKRLTCSKWSSQPGMELRTHCSGHMCPNQGLAHIESFIYSLVSHSHTYLHSLLSSLEKGLVTYNIILLQREKNSMVCFHFFKSNTITLGGDRSRMQPWQNGVEGGIILKEHLHLGG